MTAVGLRQVDEFWAGYFGCLPEEFNEARTLVVPHAALEGYDGVLAFRHGRACVVSVPAAVPEVGREKLRGAPPELAFDRELLARSLVVWPDRVSPPAWVGVCEAAEFKPAPSSARRITSDDSDALRKLAESLGEAGLNAGAPLGDRDSAFGVFVEGELVAASAYVNMGGALAYVRVVTHPRHRAQGYGRAAASASMERAFDQDLVPLWRTTASNEAAVAVARSLGFQSYAFTIDIRLSADEF